MLKSQFEDSLDIKSGVWGPSLTLSANLFLFKEGSLTLSQKDKIHSCVSRFILSSLLFVMTHSSFRVLFIHLMFGTFTQVICLLTLDCSKLQSSSRVAVQGCLNIDSRCLLTVGY